MSLSFVGLVWVQGMAEIPQSIASATFTVFGVEVRCHVLDDGQRIIEEESVEALLEAMSKQESFEPGEMAAALYRWIQAERSVGAGP